MSRCKTIWDREYLEACAIPSSSRKAPSQALLLFSELLGFRDMKRVLDAGCGNGRNSIYLAQLGMQVDAIDFSSVAVAEAKKRASRAGLLNKIHVCERDLEESLPFIPDSFDLCLDFYVFCHFIDEQVKRHYVGELWRVTKPGGYLLSALFSPQDEYYAHLITSDCEPIVIEDPANGVMKQLYTAEKFKKSFAPPFRIRYFVSLEFDDIVLGKPYRREILSMALEKPTNSASKLTSGVTATARARPI